MAVIRLANGSDIAVKLSVADTLSTVQVSAAAADFIELPGDDGPVHVRPSSVLAVIEDARRGTPGFRVAIGQPAGTE